MCYVKKFKISGFCQKSQKFGFYEKLIKIDDPSFTHNNFEKIADQQNAKNLLIRILSDQEKQIFGFRHSNMLNRFLKSAH